MTKLIDQERNVRMDLLKSFSFTNIFDFSFCSFCPDAEAYKKYTSESLKIKLDLFQINAYNWGTRAVNS